MAKLTKWLVGTATLMMLQGCVETEPIKDSLCMVDSIEWSDLLQACSQGERVLYKPDIWGNEQAPVFFAALYCNPRFSITLTNGAVACIYSPIDVQAFAKRSGLE